MQITLMIIGLTSENSLLQVHKVSKVLKVHKDHKAKPVILDKMELQLVLVPLQLL